MITVKFKKWNCVVVLTKYTNNNKPAIQLDEVETGETIAVASVNFPNLNLASDQIAIKNYSENSGIDKVLQEAGVIGKHLFSVSSGYVEVPVYELLIQND